MRCSACGAENEPGRKFCGECGLPLALICPSCAEPNPPSVKFCGECGASLAGLPRPEPQVAGAAAEPAAGPRPAPASERRLVSVLFADLVGFTTLSERRDAEEVRELLTRYFDTCRRLIARYGGVVEKFIGDAVMAVWGTPLATEDDAERAVRAAMELTTAVATLGEEVGAPELQARAGVLTGEAAVTIGAEAQGMVAGDIVNTASRIQSVAVPGSVLVGDATRRATEESIVYEDGGEHELKGKAEPLRLWRAVRVVAASRGSLKSVGLEAPFVGRDRELRMIKELFHTAAEEKRAHLASVVGIAGLGKSRLVWEFFKYVDGLADLTYWHRGRCLAYGEGVTYWALAEMVKMRARIAEEEEPASAAAKLRASVEEIVLDPEERRWVEPRLAHLLGLEERAVRDREELFSAWRLFFERMAERNPTVLVFEDLHWADPSLVDFIEHLLDWSRNHPILVLTFARPELMDRFPGWGGGKRNFTSISLDPLAPEAMERMLSGLVPGLPDELRGRILERAEGVPLYAVETVRMLLDRGLLVQEGSVYRPTGPVDTLEVPESLQALIAARLDGLTGEERQLLQDASVLGKTFFKQALAAIGGRTEPEVEPLLSSLVRKEVLGVQADPRSPERGQYGFLQDLVRKVAYDTLSKRERKARHLAVASRLEASGDEEETVELIASHYLQAYRQAPDAEDAAEIKAKARGRLIGAGEHARSLAASQEAQRYFEEAAGLAEDELDRARLIERAGDMALFGGRNDAARSLLETALRIFESEGSTHPAARVSARLAETEWVGGHLDEAIERMEDAFRVLSGEEPDEDLATLGAQLGRFHFFKGEMELALDRVDAALGIAEALVLPEVTSQALNTKGIVALAQERPDEGQALIAHALKVALDHDLPSAALRAYLNLAETLCQRDRYDEALELYSDALSLSRRVGDRFWERQCLAETPHALFMVGRWQEALERAAELPESEIGGTDVLGLLTALPPIHAARGTLQEADRVIELFRDYEKSEDLQEASAHASARATVLLAEGKYEEALRTAETALEAGLKMSATTQMVKIALDQIADAALALGDLPRVQQVLVTIDGFRPAQLPPFTRALADLTRARLAAVRGDGQGVEQAFKAAAGLFREIGVPFWLARTLAEHGEWLASQGRRDDAQQSLAEAREIFERLGATMLVDRLDDARSADAIEVDR